MGKVKGISLNAHCGSKTIIYNETGMHFPSSLPRLIDSSWQVLNNGLRAQSYMQVGGEGTAS